MYKSKTKVLLICIGVALFVLCMFISMSSMLSASAEEAEPEQSQVCENEEQLENVNASSMVTKSSSNKSEYVNLGSSRLSEGNMGLSQLHYIENANYFLANPLHRENSAQTSDHAFGTCTTVAHQMLLGYHNYYSDRRLIPEISSDGKRYLETNYGDLNSDPVFVYTPGSRLGRSNIGTRDEVFYGIFNKIDMDCLMDYLLSQTIWTVADAADAFLTECADGRTKNWTIKGSLYNKEEVVAELDAGRPVILGFEVLGSHSSHVVVAYGYANYDGNFCYITHYGWQSGNVQMLVPESWLGYQVTMEVAHAHEYESTIERYKDSSGKVYRGMECTECGSTTVVSDLYALFADGIGTDGDPFLISNAEQFNNIRYAYQTVYVPRQGGENRITYSFKLTNSIIIPGDWTPFSYKFAGKFDGNGYYITYSMNLTQTDLNITQYQGLFGFVVDTGSIHDLELINCEILSNTGTTLTASSTTNIGILAGSCFEARGISNVTVTNPKIECKISDASIGAIAGTIFSTNVTNCIVQQQNGTASITNNTHGYLGGMAGLGDLARFSGGRIEIALTNTAFNKDNDMMGKVVGNSGDSVPSGMIANVTMEQGECIAAGTLIMLADGTQKAVEELTGDEMLLVWNLETGTFDTAPILFIDSDPARVYKVIYLTFSDGTTVKTIYEHGFWDYTLNEYVYLDKDAAQYIGHWFNKLSTDESGNRVSVKVQLVDVSIQNEYTTAWSPVTYSHLCYYVNGMLSMPGGIEGLFNIFEVDAETMKYDEAQMQADIAQYGLFTYEEFAEQFPISEEVFEAFNVQYLKVAMGKGLIDADGLQTLIERYSDFLAAI